MSGLVIHIGQRKSGSTWLQEMMVAAADDGMFRYELDRIWDWFRLTNWMKDTKPDYSGFRTILADHRHHDAVLTLEMLSITPAALTVQAISEIAPQATIIMVTRNPLDYLISSYTNAMNSGKPWTIEEFATRQKRHLARSHDIAGWCNARAQWLPDGKMVFLPYELLEENASAFLREIFIATGFDLSPYAIEGRRNSKPHPAILSLIRRVNLMFDKQPHPAAASSEMNALKLFLTNAAAHSRELDKFFLTKLKLMGIETDDTGTLERVPDKVAQELDGLMAPLRDMPLYQPYLGRYGLA